MAGIRRTALLLSFTLLIICGGIAISEANATADPCPVSYSCLWGDIHYATNGNTGAYYAMNDYVDALGNHHYLGFPNFPAGNTASSGFNEGTGSDPV